jgi:superfamily II DNA/RNA helicase
MTEPEPASAPGSAPRGDHGSGARRPPTEDEGQGEDGELADFEDADGEGQSYLKEVLPFEELLMHYYDLLQAVYDLGFDVSTRIQTQTILTLCGPDPRDLQAQAQSGSGKTVAFILSMLMHVHQKIKAPQTLCLFHTRKLTLQTFAVFEDLNRYFKATGGVVLATPDQTVCSSETQLLFATPKSLEGYVRRKHFDLSKVKLFVVDDADEVMRYHGIHERPVQYLLHQLPRDVQKAFFSATYSRATTDIIRCVMRPNSISVRFETLRPKS